MQTPVRAARGNPFTNRDLQSFLLLIAFVRSVFLLSRVEKGLMLMGVVSSEAVLGEERFHTEVGWVCSGPSP